MRSDGLVRLLFGLVVLFCTSALFVLTYFGLTAPSVPFTKLDINRIDRITEPARAGDLRPQDRLITIYDNQYRGCLYLGGSPFYGAPRGVLIPVTYERILNEAPRSTNIILDDPSPRIILNRSLPFLVSGLFVGVGAIIVLGGKTSSKYFLLGAASMISGLVIAAGPDISEFYAPFSIFYWLGLPVWSVLLVASHISWPINQWRGNTPRLLFLVMVVVASLEMGTILEGSTWFGCFGSKGSSRLSGLAYIFNVFLPLPMLLFLLNRASRASSSSFSRMQIKTISWAVALGLGSPLMLSIVPLAFGFRWIAPIEITLLIGGIIPITYLFVIYKGDLLSVDKYLNRVVFAGLFIIFWGIISLIIVNGISYWIPQPDPLLVAVLASLPPLIAATITRDKLGLLIDLALHGTYYDSEVVIAQIGKQLAHVRTMGDLAEILVRDLPQALSIRQASLWEVGGDGIFSQAFPAAKDPVLNYPIKQILDKFTQQNQDVLVLNTPISMGGDAAWQVVVRMQVGPELQGFLLLGEKIRDRMYGEKDIRTLSVLAIWMAATMASIRALDRQESTAKLERDLMLSLIEKEEQVRREVAGELHDRGISALGLIRLMIDQEREPEIVQTAVHRVIDDLRDLSNNRLRPAGIDQGLPEAISELVNSHRILGLPIEMRIDIDFDLLGKLHPSVENELFYIAQEALLNVAKHAMAKSVKLDLILGEAELQMSVQDDGVGFDPTDLVNEGQFHGMRIMRARSHRIGGNMELKSQPGRGTSLIIKVPVHEITQWE